MKEFLEDCLNRFKTPPATFGDSEKKFLITSWRDSRIDVPERTISDVIFGGVSRCLGEYLKIFFYNTSETLELISRKKMHEKFLKKCRQKLLQKLQTKVLMKGLISEGSLENFLKESLVGLLQIPLEKFLIQLLLALVHKSPWNCRIFEKKFGENRKRKIPEQLFRISKKMHFRRNLRKDILSN